MRRSQLHFDLHEPALRQGLRGDPRLKDHLPRQRCRGARNKERKHDSMAADEERKHSRLGLWADSPG